MQLFNATFSTLLICVCIAVECPHDWIALRNRCYKTVSDPASWNDAANNCGRMGGLLMTLDFNSVAEADGKSGIVFDLTNFWSYSVATLVVEKIPASRLFDRSF